MGIYKRCSHRAGPTKDRCSDPWYASYSLKGRPRVRVALAKWTGRTITTKTSALVAYDLLKTEIRAGYFRQEGMGIVERSAAENSFTLGALIDLYKRDYVLARQQRTLGDYGYRTKGLTAFFGADTPISSIDGPRIEALAANLRLPRQFRGDSNSRPPSIASVNRPLSLLRRLLSWATDRGLITTRPKFTFDKEDYSVRDILSLPVTRVHDLVEGIKSSQIKTFLHRLQVRRNAGRLSVPCPAPISQ